MAFLVAGDAALQVREVLTTVRSVPPADHQEDPVPAVRAGQVTPFPLGFDTPKALDPEAHTSRLDHSVGKVMRACRILLARLSHFAKVQLAWTGGWAN